MQHVMTSSLRAHYSVPRQSVSPVSLQHIATRLIGGMGLSVLCGLTVSPGTAKAGTDAPLADLSDICDQVAVQASKATGVPISVLKAISLTETGRKRDGTFRPWPWTVNMEGKGVWFDNEDQARAYVYDNFKRGARSFDVGCFQINYKWHHQAFTSIEQMFEPLANALYAAEFLQSLFAEKGSWALAAGAYHSRTAVHADRYQARFETLRARFAAEDDLPLPDVNDFELAAAAEGIDPEIRRAVIRINTYPLLNGGQSGVLGSLVSRDAAAGQSLASAAGPGVGLFGRQPDSGDDRIADPAGAVADTILATSEEPDPVSDPAFVNLGGVY